MPLNVSRRALLACATGIALPQEHTGSPGKQYLVYFGTYTTPDPRYGGKGESEGIYVAKFDSGTGKLSSPQVATRTSDPSYLVIHLNRRHLYAVNEEVDQTGKAPGAVSAFSIDRSTGRLTSLNRVPSKGGMPCHISTDKTGTVVAVANWSTGSAATFPVLRDGRLGEAVGFQQHAGERSGPQPGAPGAAALPFSQRHSRQPLSDRDGYGTEQSVRLPA